jgi:leucyl/phenylalanyl-tRNA---protein transferase
VHSIEAWRGNKLVGGLYGVSFGAAFYGESMFALEPDASKIAFATLLANLVAWNFDIVDCQQHTAHLERFGAEDWPRDRFLDALTTALRAPTRDGPWTLDIGPKEAAERIQG